MCQTSVIKIEIDETFSSQINDLSALLSTWRRIFWANKQKFAGMYGKVGNFETSRSTDHIVFALDINSSSGELY